VIHEGHASRREIQEWWSIDDLADANDAIDAWQEAEAQQRRREAEKGHR